MGTRQPTAQCNRSPQGFFFLSERVSSTSIHCRRRLRSWSVVFVISSMPPLLFWFVACRKMHGFNKTNGGRVVPSPRSGFMVCRKMGGTIGMPRCSLFSPKAWTLFNADDVSLGSFRGSVELSVSVLQCIAAAGLLQGRR